MSPVRLFRYAPPRRSRGIEKRQEYIFDPSQGLDVRTSPSLISTGYTADSMNFEKIGREITPRSGVSSFGGYTLGAPSLHGMVVRSVEDDQFGVFASSMTISVMDEVGGWSTLSYVDSTPNETAMDSSFVAGVDGTYIYDIEGDRNIAVLTNNRQLPKWWVVEDSTTTFSNFTWVTSQFSRAATVEAFDNRLVWFNVASSASTFPNRVVWSASGRPKDMAVANGGGFEDLMSMRGSGKAQVVDGDELVLFSEEQIWRARRREDVFAFTFYPAHPNMGCPFPRTITQTPFGIVFLGKDYDLYVMSGGNIAPFGGEEGRARRFIAKYMRNAATAWAAYNHQTHTYQLFFTFDGSSTFHANSALFFNLDNGSVWPQKFGTGLSAGFAASGTYEGPTWGTLQGTWAELQVTWGELGQIDVTPYRTIVATSTGTAAALHPSATSDLGTAIDARWKSSAIPALGHITLSEVWAEYASDSASTVTVSTYAHGTDATGPLTARRLSASSISNSYFPVLGQGKAVQFEVQVADGTKPTFSRFLSVYNVGGDF